MLKRYSNNTISIRAPAKGATCSTYLCFGIFLISIRAPAKGATKVRFHSFKLCNISIRAPAKGATQALSSLRPYLPVFQSALPRRERRNFLVKTIFHQDFNPRSREGSDFFLPCTCVTFSIFQSALPRRERLKDSINQCPEVRISIRAPAKGATHQPWISRLRQYISIRAPAKGATVDAIHAVLYCIISIRAPAKGATGHARKQFCHIFYFNPRSREGSDSNIIQQFSFFCIILYILSVIT